MDNLVYNFIFLDLPQECYWLELLPLFDLGFDEEKAQNQMAMEVTSNKWSPTLSGSLAPSHRAKFIKSQHIICN